MGKIPNSDQNQNFKPTYLADFFMEIRNFYIFEQELIPSRALFYGNFVFFTFGQNLHFDGRLFVRLNGTDLSTFLTHNNISYPAF